MPEAAIIPDTGEVLATRTELVEALREIEERMAPMYEARRRVRRALGTRFEPTLPERRRDRTAKQDAVTRCPRCGDRLPKEEEVSTTWRWATIAPEIKLTVTLDSDDPDLIARVEDSARSQGISLVRQEEWVMPEEQPPAAPPPDLSESLE